MFMHIIYRWHGDNNWTCYYLGYDVNKANFIAQHLMSVTSICYITRFNNDDISIWNR